MLKIKTNPCRVWILSCLLWICPLSFAIAGGPTVVVVDENNADWGFLDEGGTPVSGFVQGPDTPPMGLGSGNFQLTGGADGVLAGTLLQAGLRLTDLTALTYSTYQSITPQAIALQFNVDYDDTDGTVSWQGRLVYEPSYTQTVLTDTWQAWDTLVASGTGNWWSTGTPIVGDVAAAVACTQGNPCTWPEMLGAYPDAAIHLGALGAMLLKAGSGWPAGFDGNFDALHLTTATNDVLYDFETIVPVELLTFSVE